MVRGSDPNTCMPCPSRESLPEVASMTLHDVMATNRVFAWLAVATSVLLLIPLVAMQITDSVHWTLGDFVVMGGLLFVTGTGFVLVARRVPHRWRLLLDTLIAAAFAYVWAELAVGVFTNLGS